MSRKPAITATGLKKAYDDKTVLDGIDISVDRGTVFALLGPPNGAGKTTIVEILSTLVPADGGNIRIAGYNPSDDPDAVRSRIGVTGQFSAVDDYLSGEENLLLMADLHHLGKDERRTRTEELLKKFDLIDSADKLASTYSGGMRRRLDLAMTLIGRPEIIFLDEPTTGLDPPEADAPCGRSSGSWSRAVSPSSSRPSTSRKLINWPTTSPSSIRDGSSPKVRQRNSNGTSPGGHIRLHFFDRDQLDSAAAVFDESSRDDAAYVLQVPQRRGGVRSLRSLLDQLDAHSIDVKELSVHTPDLDDVFLTLTATERTDAR